MRDNLAAKTVLDGHTIPLDVLHADDPSKVFTCLFLCQRLVFRFLSVDE